MSATATIPNATNLANSQFSTGPKTKIGKDAIKFNALKTGLYARTVVLPDEDQAAYEIIGAALTEHWNPRTGTERELIATIQNTMWRQERAVQIEFNLYAIGALEQLEAIQEKFSDQPVPVQYALAQAAAYRANLRAFDQISKQDARLQRLIDSATRELSDLVSMHVRAAAAPAPQPAAAPSAVPTGFVPPKYPKNMPTFSGPDGKQHRRNWLRKNGLQNLA